MKDENGSQEDNLVYLALVIEARQPFGCIVDRPKGVHADSEANTWTYRGKTYPIGQKRPIRKLPRLGQQVMLGVYDKGNFHHIQQMFQDSRAFLGRRKQEKLEPPT